MISTACLREIIWGVVLESSTTSHVCRRPTTMHSAEICTTAGCDGPAGEHLGCLRRCPLHSHVHASQATVLPCRLWWGAGCVSKVDCAGVRAAWAEAARRFGVRVGSKAWVAKLNSPGADTHAATRFVRWGDGAVMGTSPGACFLQPSRTRRLSRILRISWGRMPSWMCVYTPSPTASLSNLKVSNARVRCGDNARHRTALGLPLRSTRYAHKCHPFAGPVLAMVVFVRLRCTVGNPSSKALLAR